MDCEMGDCAVRTGEDILRHHYCMSMSICRVLFCTYQGTLFLVVFGFVVCTKYRVQQVRSDSGSGVHLLLESTTTNTVQQASKLKDREEQIAILKSTTALQLYGVPKSVKIC